MSSELGVRSSGKEKYEARNSKQARMSKIRMIQTGEFRILIFEIWICFGFRYSDFGF
jgi:hypothetical protein